MKLITFLLASTEATKLASEASWNSGQYVPWTPPANASWNTGAYEPWTPEETTATVNAGAWVDDSANYDWGQWNNNSSTNDEVAEDPVATLEQFNDIWDTSPAPGSFVVNTPEYNDIYDNSPAAGSFVVNTPEAAIGAELSPPSMEITTTGEDYALTQDELDLVNSFITTEWQNDMPWMNVDTDASTDADATAFPAAPVDDGFLNTSW